MAEFEDGRPVCDARAISSVQTPPALADPVPAPPAAPAAPSEIGRDHALGLHRFLGVAQILGGVTLAAAYAAGAPSLAVGGAGGALVVIGLLQITIGVLWLVRIRALRTHILRHPGLFVATTMAGALLVLILGGSNKDTLFITSAMCWLTASGYALPGLRIIPATAFVTVVAGGAWILIEGSSGGYLLDGNYGAALIELAAASACGLWLGRATGTTFSTLNRWHLVEVHERGLVGQIRERLRSVDGHAARLSGLLTGTQSSGEINALRTRLALGVGLGESGAPEPLAALMAEIAADYEEARPTARLEIDLTAAAHAAELAATTADALVAVIRRQLLNVGRHAPEATVVRLSGSLQDGSLLVRIEDDGAGRLPFRAGTGTAWSTRQLDRVGGAAKYYAGDAGVGFEISVPLAASTSLSEVPGLSVRSSLDELGNTMLTVLRIAGYIGDSLVAYVASGDIGDRWLVMPVGAVLIELVIRFGIPRVTVGRDARLLAATLLSVLVTATFAIPANSPEVLIPATTSVVIPAHLLFVKRNRWWIFFELLRIVAALPLLARYGAAAVELVLIYPVGFSLMVMFVRRYVDRARGLEASVADGLGRAALAGATVRGLSLHHDAVDVILRSGDDDPELREVVGDLADALDRLAESTSGTLDPREVMLTGVQSALLQPVTVGGAIDPTLEPGGPALAAALDRIGLIELAALAADERSSCTPPGMFGRRRLRTVGMDWLDGSDGGQAEVVLVAEPSLGPPDPRTVSRLKAVAESMGAEVDSTPERLRLTYRRP